MQTRALPYFAISLLLLSFQTAWAKNGLDVTANALAIQPGETSALFAGTSKGLMVNRDGTWNVTGLEGKNVIDVVISASKPQTIYAVSEEEGLYVSNDAGNEWRVMQTRADGVNYEIKTIAITPTNTSTILAASKDGYILESLDGGKSWRVINPDFPLTAINTVALHAGEDKTIFVGTGGNGILKSSDDGKTWTELNGGLTDRTVTRILVSNDNSSHMYAGTYGGGIFRSTDGGNSWQAINDGLSGTFVYSMAMLPDSSSGEGIMSWINKLKDGDAASEILAGVFGGDIYRRNTKDDMEWRPL